MLEEEKKGDQPDLKELQAQIEHLQAQVKTMAQASPGAEVKEVATAKEVENSSAVESKKEEKQEPVYETMFGDRRRVVKETPKKIVLLLAIALAVVIIGYALLMTPSGFKVPSSADNLDYFAKASDYDTWTDEENYFAQLDKPSNAKAAQCNIIFDNARNLFANVFCYEFDSADDAAAYLEAKHGQPPQIKKKLSGTIGEYTYDSEQGGYSYIAWFNGKMLVEIFGTETFDGTKQNTAAWVRQAMSKYY